MRKLISFLKKRHLNFFWYNFYFQFFFSYHLVFFGSLINRGRKLFAFNFFLKIKKGIKLKEDYNPYLVFLVAMFKLTPNIMLTPLRKSGVIHGVPMPINARKQITFSVKWVTKILKTSSRSILVSRVVDALVLAIYGKGASYKKKIELYKTGILNKHYLRFFK